MDRVEPLLKLFREIEDLLDEHAPVDDPDLNGEAPGFPFPGLNRTTPTPKAR